MSTARVLEFKQPSTDNAPVGGVENHSARVRHTNSEVASPRSLTAADLYRHAEHDSVLPMALAVLSRVQVEITAAIAGIQEELSFIEIDTYLMKAQTLLETALRYRKIGDGYGSAVSALVFALSNRGSNLLKIQQLRIVNSTIVRLMELPYLHFDSAMNLIDELEECDLSVEPPALDVLTLSVEEIRE